MFGIKCVKCGKEFIDLPYLEMHIKSIHLNNKNNEKVASGFQHEDQKVDDHDKTDDKDQETENGYLDDQDMSEDENEDPDDNNKNYDKDQETEDEDLDNQEMSEDENEDPEDHD